MIATSAAYKSAILNNEPQRAIIRFANAVFTNEDISVTSGGISFNDRLNEENELTIGAAPSNSIEVALINTGNALNDYEFGRFTAAIGVRTLTGEYAHEGNVTVELGIGGKRFTGISQSPYLLENGVECAMHPSFPVMSIVVDGAVVYCFGESVSQTYAFRIDGDTWDTFASKTWNDMSEYSWNGIPNTYRTASKPTNLIAGTVKKIEALINSRTGIVIDDNRITHFRNGLFESYEYVKLGEFIAPRPANLKRRIVSLEADDLMQLFDNALIDDVEIRYPITLSGLINRICEHQGIRFKSFAFINRDITLEKRPDAFDEATQKEVISWIAEAACSYAKINRDGELELRWYKDANTTYDENDYKDFDTMSYQVKHVDGLKIRNGNSYTEEEYGDNNNVYLIQDNPFLRPDDSDAKTDGTAKRVIKAAESNEILTRITDIPEFHPASSTLFADPSIESGDIVHIMSGDSEFDVPAYSAKMQWHGSTIVEIDNSGNETRSAVPPLEQREEYHNEQLNYGYGNAIGSLGGRMDDTDEWRRYASIDIDEAKAKISLLAGEEFGDIDSDTYTLRQAAMDMSAANGILLYHSETIKSVEGGLEQALASISVNANAITQRVKKGNIISEINQTAERVKIEADKIDLSGYVTASQLSSALTTLENGIADEFYVGDFSCGTFKFGTTSISRSKMTVLTGVTMELTATGGVVTGGKLNKSYDTIYYLDWE